MIPSVGTTLPNIEVPEKPVNPCTKGFAGFFYCPNGYPISYLTVTRLAGKSNLLKIWQE